MTTVHATGINHVATLTADLDRYVEFYVGVLGAGLKSTDDADGEHPRNAVLDIGGSAMLHAFEVPEDAIVGNRGQIGGRGPIDHFGVAAACLEDFEQLRQKLIASGASSGEVRAFGPALSLFFRDPDGAELELCCNKADAGRSGGRVA